YCDDRLSHTTVPLLLRSALHQACRHGRSRESGFLRLRVGSLRSLPRWLLSYRYLPPKATACFKAVARSLASRRTCRTLATVARHRASAQPWSVASPHWRLARGVGG